MSDAFPIGPTDPLPSDISPEALYRLAHFDPTYKDEHGSVAVDYLVLQALATYGRFRVTAAEVKGVIGQLFYLDYEEVEINAAAERLGKRGLVVYESRSTHEKPSFCLNDETEKSLSADLVRIQEAERSVYASWREEYERKYSDLPEVADNKDRVENCIKIFATSMLRRHGVQCVNLLYPDGLKAQRWLEDIKNDILTELPRLGKVTDAVVALEVPAFFESKDIARREYINSLFNSSFFWHLLQVDETCSELLRAATTEQALYVDVNVLYSLIGLDGQHLMQVSHSLVHLASSLGHRLFLTTKSIEEFHYSLTAQLNNSQLKPQLPRELARLAAGSLEEENFVTVFWREYAKHGTSMQEFVHEKSHVESVLDGLGIETTAEHRSDLDGSDALKEQESLLRTVCGRGIDAHILEHDAFHRLFVDRMRGRPRYNYSDAGAWFLTNDTKLRAYDHEARTREQRRRELPFCIMSGEWIQVNRPLLARVANAAEYDAAFQTLVTRPFLRSITQSFSLTEALNSVLSRASRFRNMNPQLALKLVTDKRFIITAALEADPVKADELIESKLADIVTGLQAEVTSLRSDATAKDQKVDDLLMRLTSLEGTQASAEAGRARQLAAKDQQLEEERKAHDKTKREVERLRKFQLVTAKWVIFGATMAVLVLGIWALPYWLSWRWLWSYDRHVYLQAVVQWIVLFGLLNIPLHKHWKTWLASGLAPAALALLALLLWTPGANGPS